MKFLPCLLHDSPSPSARRRPRFPSSRLLVLGATLRLVVATTAGHSLAVCEDGSGVLVSSEALDEHDGWRPVPDRHLVTATEHGIDFTPLGDA